MSLKNFDNLEAKFVQPINQLELRNIYFIEFSCLLAICKRCRDHLQELVLKHAPPISQASISPDVSASYQLPQEDETSQDKESSEGSEHEAMQIRFVKGKAGKMLVIKFNLYISIIAFGE